MTTTPILVGSAAVVTGGVTWSVPNVQRARTAGPATSPGWPTLQMPLLALWTLFHSSGTYWKEKIKGTKCPLGFIMDFDVMICIIFVLKFETSPVLTKAFEKITQTSRLLSSVLLDICYRNEERYFNFRWNPASEKITSSNRLITILFLCLIGINVVVYNWRFLIATMKNWRCRRIVQF